MPRPGTLRWAMMAAALLPVMAAAQAECRAVFPQARVKEHAAAPRFAACEGAALGYAEQLSEQRALLETLRPAYARKLGAADAAAQKLAGYDDDVLRLGDASTHSGKMFAAAAASAPAAAASHAAAARRWLKDSKTLSQLLGDRIGSVAEQLGDAEKAPFCKHDFVLRLALELNARLVDCVKPE